MKIDVKSGFFLLNTLNYYSLSLLYTVRTMFNKLRLAVLFSLVSSLVFAQPLFNKVENVVVKQNGQSLKNPWVGGLNACQFSTIDLNLDGIEDLFVFDRVGGKISTYINQGTPNTPDYVFAPGYRGYFSFVHDWVLLRDYNGDGKKDIFSYSSGAIQVHKNVSDQFVGLAFEQVTDAIYSNYNPLAQNPLYVAPNDIPSLVDIDKDGDLDVLTFHVFGAVMEFHKNLSMENHGNADHLEFKMEEPCWCNFEEGAESFAIELGVTCKGGNAAPNPEEANLYRHVGSCSVVFDNDGDGDMDLLLGDVSALNMVMLTNGGDANYCNSTSKDESFPSSNTPVNMAISPCGFYEDVDYDGKRDLIVSPLVTSISQNYQSVWWYKNTGQDNNPNFVLQQNDFLQSDMIELGEGAYPVFYDVDQDGLIDMLVGNYGYYAPGGLFPSKMAYYRNTGTATSPEFTLITRDYANLSSQGLSSMIPTFGDIDDDGVDEMILGEISGAIHLFENSAGVGQPANFTLAAPVYQSIDIGQFSAPQLFDVDDDGLLDLVIGERNGNLNYYKNTGTATNPTFTQVTDKFGFVDVRLPLYNVGYSRPFMFWYEGDLQLLVGCEGGNIFFYDDIENNLSDTFNLVSNRYINIWEGIHSSITGADLNNDGLLDFAIGNYCGGLAYFKGDTTLNPPSGVVELNKPLNINLYPNPAKDELTVELDQPNGAVTIEIYNLAGQRLMEQQFQAAGVLKMRTESLAEGFYILKLTSGNNSASKKFAVMR